MLVKVGREILWRMTNFIGRLPTPFECARTDVERMGRQ
jgi:hypothetical protein